MSTPTRTASTGESISPADAERRRRLIRMKTLATIMLIGMAGLFVVGYLLEDTQGWAAYLRAAAEAGMVGALADWFAVTALFRRPLGLPIPHTAIIPTRKDAIGASLSEFVATNFLSESVVRERLARLSVAERLGGYLATRETAERIVAEGASAVRGLASVLSDDQISELLAGLVRRRIDAAKVGPILGGIAADVFARGDHHALVDVVVERVHEWIRDNPTRIVAMVTERAPVWTPRFLDERVGTRLFRELETFLHAVRTEPDHPLRSSLDAFLAKFADDLQHDPATMAKAEAIKYRLLNNDAVQSLAGSAWATVKQTVLDAVDDPASELRAAAIGGLVSLGRRLSTDTELAAKVNTWVADAVGYLARHHARSITGIIDETIARWDGPATSRRIELQIGRDLQFIRINGTVVGALAGLAIYAVARAVL